MISPTVLRAAFFFLGIILVFNELIAQYPRKDAQKVLDYTFVGEGGSDATAVVWVPGANMYVTAVAGDAEFPLEGFSAKGRNLWTTNVDLDVRGMWYNPKKKRLEANGQGSEGWSALRLDENGDPIGTFVKFLGGKNQPDEESVLSSTGKLVVGLYNGRIYHYALSNGKYKNAYTLGLSEGRDSWELNDNTICYTGVAEFPLAALDVEDGGVVFFDLKGNFLFYTKLPESTPLPRMYRFSFANQYAWIFDDETRTWSSYRVFH